MNPKKRISQINYYNLLEFSRKLEKELQELQEKYDKLLILYNELQKSCSTEFIDVDTEGILNFLDENNDEFVK